MKRIFLLATFVVLAWVFSSCGGDNYQLFVGTWGVEKLEYDTLDFAGAPIVENRETYYFTPGDIDNGIEMIFRNDHTGETRDHAIDTLKYMQNGVQVAIYCPDTTLITKFTYSYLPDEAILYLNILDDEPYTYMTRILKFENNAFLYENNYKTNCIERAWLVRTSNTPAAKSTKSVGRQRHEGSLFSK